MSSSELNAGKSGVDLLALYRTMSLIRVVELRLSKLFADGEIPGFIHLSIGQEAVAAGVMSALNSADTIASNHRGHGHSLAKGIPLDKFFLELLAKRDGACGGRGGSMHVADLSVGMLGANGIVAAGIPIALGSALAHKTLKRDSIAVVFFGDGARAEGVLHESLNIASLRGLPILFVCENNGWSEFSSADTQFAADLMALSDAFKIKCARVDGCDVEAVAKETVRLVGDIRSGQGPRLLECITKRVHGHFEGDAQKYRDAAEMSGLAQFDPVIRAEALLLQQGRTPQSIAQIKAEIEDHVDAAVDLARGSEGPDFASAMKDVYTPEGV